MFEQSFCRTLPQHCEIGDGFSPSQYDDVEALVEVLGGDGEAVGRFNDVRGFTGATRQPVIGVAEDVRLDARDDVVPVVYQPPVYEGDESDFGLGNFNPSFFFVKQINPKLMMGAGPTLLLPTNTGKGSISRKDANTGRPA